MGKIIKGVTNFAKKVGDIAGGVVNFANKAISFIQKPMDMITAPIKKLAGNVLDKLPFGVGKFIKPFADKLIDHGLSLLAGPVTGGMSIFAKALPTIQKVADFAEKVKGVADTVGALGNQPAQQNFQNIMAHAQAAQVW